MDKLRALQYFSRAAERGSFAAAARFFDVSTPAVTQLVGALERSLGVTLFRRTKQGIALTDDGERYYQTARRVVAELRDAEQRMGPRGTSPRGALAVGMNASLGQTWVIPRITRFLARYPDIELVLKAITTVEDIEEKTLDLALLVGWPPERDLVVRSLAQTRLVVCASPAYWARHGIPAAPDDLRGHSCLVLRSSGGTLMDRWSFARNGEQRPIDVKTRFFSDDRSWLVEAAANGGGVIRMTDVVLQRYLSAGLLVPVLEDWEVLEAPTIFAAYAPSQRRSKLVRVFLDFLVDVFADFESERAARKGGLARVPKPDWFGHAHGRHSAYAARRRSGA